MGILGSDAPHHLDPRRYGNAVAFRVARRLGRRTVTAAGCWGRVTGHADDDVMLRHYGRCGTWSAATVGAMTAAVHAAPDRP